ncbi:MAG TPA: Mpo1-like protein [Planctomycetia bacterium]|nr:Mpo1-like protein [Planctomycetia bacterium]
MLRKIIANWLTRHQNPVSFWLHMVGIPATVVGVGFWIAGQGWLGTALFLGGYGLQFVGHAIEGNDVGELIPIKKLLGMPVVPVAPQYLPKADPASEPTS